jgi:hypothetical protein
MTEQQLTNAIVLLGPAGNTANHPAAYVALAQGYLAAGDALFERLPANLGTNYDPLVPPIMFLYRHALELGLKALIRAERYLGGAVRKGVEDNEHRLGELLKIADQHLPTYVDRLSDEYRKVISAFDQLDNRSYEFRYPTSKGGSPSRATWMFEINPVHDAVSAARDQICGSIALQLLARLADEEERQRAILST